MTKTLTINLPQSFVSALHRRHHGVEHTEEEIQKKFKHITELYNGYKKSVNSLNKLWEFWNRENVESYFKRPKWYNAHSRRRKLEEKIKRYHEYMFSTLTSFDGNSGQSFSTFHCISPEEIYEDFLKKYIK